MKYWSRSALSIYRYLETMSNTIDKIVISTGKNSNSSLLQRYQTTYYQAGKMIELSERKRKMINLKIAVEDSLVSLNLIDKRILGLVFIDGVKSERVAKLLNMSLRTFFRRKTKALNNFMEEMELSGYNAEYFMKEYSQEKWFISVYNECLHKRSSEDVFSGNLFKRVINEVSQIRLPSNNFV